MPFAAFAILHGGAIKPANFDPARARPMLLIAAAEDAHQKPRMDELDALLTSRGVPHTYEVRPGGHALTDEDIARALAFFEEVAHVRAEKMPVPIFYRLATSRSVPACRCTGLCTLRNRMFNSSTASANAIAK